jgi:uncharacterized membrane protein YkvA (DUF1232 family)
MASTMRRAAAFTALWRALVSNKGGPTLGQRMSAVPRLVGQTLMGRYDGASRLLLILGGMVYVASPIDLLPDFILIPGLLDDAMVITWLAGAVLSETERFLRWERERDRARGVVIDGDVA